MEHYKSDSITVENIKFRQPESMYFPGRNSPDIAIKVGITDILVKSTNKHIQCEQIIRENIFHPSGRNRFTNLEKRLLKMNHSELLYDVYRNTNNLFYDIQDAVQLPDREGESLYQNVCDKFKIIIFIYLENGELRTFYPIDGRVYPILYLSYSSDKQFGLIKKDKLYATELKRHLREIESDHFDENRLFDPAKHCIDSLCMLCFKEVTINEKLKRDLLVRAQNFQEFYRNIIEETGSNATENRLPTEAAFSEFSFFDSPSTYLSFTTTLTNLCIETVISLENGCHFDTEKFRDKLEIVLNDHQGLKNERFSKSLENYLYNQMVYCDVCENPKPSDSFGLFCNKHDCVVCNDCRTASVKNREDCCVKCKEIYSYDKVDYLMKILRINVLPSENV